MADIDRHRQEGACEFQELIERCKNGDREALGVLFEQYEDDLLRVARRAIRKYRLDGKFEPRDILQSVLLRLVQFPKGGDFATPDQFLAYLRRALENKAREKVRRNARRPDHEQPDPQDGSGLDDLPAADVDPQMRAIVDDLRSQMRNNMSAAEWEFFCLRQRGRSWGAIALRLQIKTETARKRYERLVQRVRGDLGFDL